MSAKNTLATLANSFGDLATPDGMQKYILGTKKNGQPRALYDIVKDFTKDSKGGKKKKKESADNMYAFYLSTKEAKKKKKKKKKNKDKDYWHI